jgi:hypothetical protein
LREEAGRGWGRGEGVEMTQTMYAHVNKRIIIKKRNYWRRTLGKYFKVLAQAMIFLIRL